MLKRFLYSLRFYFTGLFYISGSLIVGLFVLAFFFAGFFLAVLFFFIKRVIQLIMGTADLNTEEPVYYYETP